jgi:hypothetical protein
MRQLVAVVAGAAAACVGALIAGEYPFTGVVPYVVGILLGMAIAELVVAIARRATIVLGAICAVVAAAAVAYAAWDDAGFGVRPIAASAWAGVVVAFVTGGLRGGWWASGRQARAATVGHD